MSRRTVLLAVILGSFSLVAGGASAGDADGLRAQAIEPDQIYDGFKSPAGLVSVLVRFDADPTATYKGGIPGLGATSPQVTGSRIRRGEHPRCRRTTGTWPERNGTSERRSPAPSPARGSSTASAPSSAACRSCSRETRSSGSRGCRTSRPSTPTSLLPLDTDRSTAFIGAPALWSKLGGQGKAGRRHDRRHRRQRHLAREPVGPGRRRPAGASREVDGHGLRVRLGQAGRSPVSPATTS